MATTRIEAARFQEIYGGRTDVTVREQAGFVRIEATNGLRLYVAKTKEVARVDLSGFTMDGGTVALGGEAKGGVSQRLDFSLSADEVLSNFRRAIDLMVSLPKPEKAKRLAPTTSAKAAKEQYEAHVPGTSVASPMSSEEKAKRLALIRMVAEQKGVPVSKKTILALEDVSDIQVAGEEAVALQ